MFDLILLAIIAISGVLGLFRGFLAMVLGIASWLIASWASWRFGDAASQWLADGQSPALIQLLYGHGLVFMLVIVAFSLAGFLLRRLLESTSLTALDRLLGLLVGTARGVFIASLVTFLTGLTPFSNGPSWQSSVVVPVLSPLATRMKQQLPMLVDAALEGSDKSDMGKNGAASDNADSNDIAVDND